MTVDTRFRAASVRALLSTFLASVQVSYGSYSSSQSGNAYFLSSVTRHMDRLAS